MWQFFMSVVLFLAMWNSVAYGKTTVQEDFTGTLLITTPDGDLELIDSGEPVPEIVPNSVLEVFGGKFTVTTEAGDTVSCACLDHEMTVTGGASASVTCDEEAGLLKVLSGSVALVDEQGVEHTILEGKEYPIRPDLSQPAPPAEATEETDVRAVEVGGDLPPVDSRSLEASPS